MSVAIISQKLGNLKLKATPAGSPAEMEAGCIRFCWDSWMAGPWNRGFVWQVWARKSLESMRSLICSPKCLWNSILKYFGEDGENRVGMIRGVGKTLGLFLLNSAFVTSVDDVCRS